jgi:DNA-binding MarR family transcriptional regulator
MKLEEEIKQQRFQTPYHRMAVNIMFTGNWIHKDLSCQLRAFGLSLQQHNVLSILKGQYPQPCTLGLIQERMLDRESNATRLIDKLLQKGLVDRCQCAENRRKVDILITKAGLALLEETAAIMQNIPARYQHLSPEEATLLGHLLDKLRE